MEYPRRAGKSCPVHRRCSRHRDHPRVGGEKSLSTSTSIRRLGSPPRRRGKVHDFDQIGRSAGITPAWAGKRFWNRPWVWATSDHPRVGGEKRTFLWSNFSFQGSSPRGRGKVLHPAPSSRRHRITPAWAGKGAPNERWTQWQRITPAWAGKSGRPAPAD